MKKIIIIGLLSMCAAGVSYAQGTLNFINDIPGIIVTHIYSPNTANPAVSTTGQGPGDTGAQTATYPNSVAIGGASFTGTAPASLGASSPLYADGNLFTAQVYAVNKAQTPSNPGFSGLSPVTQYITTLSTSAGGAGFVIQPTFPGGDPGIIYAGTMDDAVNNQTIDNKAWVSVAAWYNGLGQFPTLASAIAASVPNGHSTVFSVNTLGMPADVETAANQTPSSATPAANMSALTSFSLVSPVPEPSTIALGVMGACAFLARRRKK